MFKFDLALILPLFLSRRITVAELAKQAKTSHASVSRALHGESVGALVLMRVAEALGIPETDVPSFLAKPSTPVIC